MILIRSKNNDQDYVLNRNSKTDTSRDSFTHKSTVHKILCIMVTERFSNFHAL